MKRSSRVILSLLKISQRSVEGLSRRQKVGNLQCRSHEQHQLVLHTNICLSTENLHLQNVEFAKPYLVNNIFADFSKVQQSFAHSMKNFKFEIIGETQTQEEIMIGNFLNLCVI